MTDARTGGVALVTDSSAGLADRAADLSCAVVPLELEICGRVYHEGPELSSESFYLLLREAGGPPETRPPAVDEFVRVYRALLDTHDSILSLHLSGELSRTVERAGEAAGRIGARDRVLAVDTRLAGVGLGLLCLEARALLAAGASATEAEAAVRRIAAATRIWFSVYSLDFLYLGGRLERIRGTGSALADDRPILALDGGRLTLLERVVGETTRVERTIRLAETAFGAGEPLVAGVTHAGERGQAAAAMLEHMLADAGADVRLSSPLDPVLCAHTGFDVCGIAAYPRRLSVTA